MAVHAGRDGRGPVSADVGPAGRVRAWDLPTRLFKWLLVTLVVTGYLTQRSGAIGWHVWNGYAILVLVAFRILWGLVGSSTSRFAAWLTWPWQAATYGLALMRGGVRPYLGHNPLGGWMIVALLVLVAAQGVSGLFTVDSNGLAGGPFANLDFGDPTPLQSFLSRWHHRIYYILLAFVFVHVLANALYQFVKNDPLITGMITGEKPALPYADEPAMRPAPASGLRALACLALAVAVVFGSVKLGGGELPPWP